MTVRRLIRAAWISAAALAVGGCGYYLQVVNGQMDVLRRARPIEAVMDDPGTPEKLKRQLVQVGKLRDYASAELGLPDNRSFRRYADLQRPFAVWNVFAAPEFSTKPRQWCFAFVGCVDYRGYFSEAAAEEAAASLRRQGDDVYVAGIPAYSTLGWFDDPVLSTVKDYPAAELASLMFHELAHQVAYVSGDTVFNESFAVTVEREGTRRWLDRFGTEEQRTAFEAALQRSNDFTALVAKYQDRLDVLYASHLSDEDKRTAKARTLREMREEYVHLKATQGSLARYDRWFAQDINNAQLAAVSLYAKMVPAFQALLARDGGDLPRFYRDVKSLVAMPAPERSAALCAGSHAGQVLQANRQRPTASGRPR